MVCLKCHGNSLSLTAKTSGAGGAGSNPVIQFTIYPYIVLKLFDSPKRKILITPAADTSGFMLQDRDLWNALK
jgi:hypothetical protein